MTNNIIMKFYNKDDNGGDIYNNILLIIITI